MIHAMIDLETLSTNPNATILTVGGVKFDPYTSEEPSQGMYFRVDVNKQTSMGRDVMQDTGGVGNQKKYPMRHLAMITEYR